MTRQAACTQGACASASASPAVSVLLHRSLSDSRAPSPCLAVLECDGSRVFRSVLRKRSMHTNLPAVNLARCHAVQGLAP